MVPLYYTGLTVRDHPACSSRNLLGLDLSGDRYLRDPGMILAAMSRPAFTDRVVVLLFSRRV